jgi:hypothetical protein
MARRLLTTWGITCLLVAGSYGAATNAVAAGGGGCQLTGTATFAPNGPGTADSFGYSFTGHLANCQSNQAGAPASGDIAAGQVVTESVPLTITNPDGTTTTQQGTARYQEPMATGTGSIPGASCAAGATSGTAVTTWSDGGVDVIDYTTQSAAAGVALQGTVVPSVTLALVPGSESIAGAAAPASYVLRTTSTVFAVGDGAVGVLAFEVTDPTQCNTATGVTAAGIDGFVGVGTEN